MSRDLPLDSPEAFELHQILRAEYMRGETSALVMEHEGRILLWFMAVTTGMLGLLLATIQRPGELEDKGSLSHRAVPGDYAPRPDHWEYRFKPNRFPIDQSITFELRIYFPREDLPEVVARLRAPLGERRANA